MFIANPTDASLSPIRYADASGLSVPRDGAIAVVPTSPSYRTSRGQLVTFAGLVLAASVIGFGAGRATSPSTDADLAVAPVVDVAPQPGEFRLAPGLQQPVGIAVPLATTKMEPKPGEFRLAPGLQQPVGIAVPLATKTTIEPKPGEFRLAPGLQQPVGIAVPLD